jgi:hypothetical protein
MRCCELHRQTEGCKQEIAEAGGWRFCPTCGRSTGHIALPDALAGQFSVPLGAEVTRSLTLRNEGLAPVRVNVDLEPGVEGVRLAPGQRRELEVPARLPRSVEIAVPALAQDARSLGTLVLRAADAPIERGDDPWKERDARVIRLPLAARVEAPARLSSLEEIALFREGVHERLIHLINAGGTRLDIQEILRPDGYDAVIAGDSRRLGPGEQLECRVTRLWHLPAEPEALLRVRSTDGQERGIALHCPPAGGVRALERAIIGIDFGTTFTSITFRECRHRQDLPDDVEFLLPPGEQHPRFPTRLWLGRRGEMVFGTEANRQYELDPAAGFRFREIKTALRDNANVHIDPKRTAAEGRDLARQRFAEGWIETLVTEYLRWLYQKCIVPDLTRRFGTAAVDVRYIFSLPVLDYGREGQPQYERQKAAMARCIARAGFPLHAEREQNRVEFEFEPVCAAVGLLHPPAGASEAGADSAPGTGWPVLGSSRYPITEGDAIAVYDSGGGTSDVVLARIHFDPKNRVALRIERCLGVGSDAETFGGEWVTDEIERPLREPALFIREWRATDWYTGTTDFSGLMTRYQDGTEELRREKAEEIKFQLSAGQDFPIPDAAISSALRPRLLDLLVDPRLESLEQALNGRVFDPTVRGETRYYLFVGGNTRLAYVRHRIERFMQDLQADYNGRRLLLPEGYRQLAIAYGAAWVPDARIRNAVPYGLAAIVATGDFKQTLLALPRNQSQDVMPRSQRFGLPPRAHMEVRVEVEIGAKPLCAGAARIFNPGDREVQCELWTEMQQGALRISFALLDPSQAQKPAPRPLLTYSL